MKFLKAFLLLPLAVVALAGPAMAQAKVIVIDRDRILAQSQVGQHVAERLTTIEAEMAAELQAIGAPLAQERDALNAETASMTPAAVQARPDLMQRIEALNANAAAFEQARRIRAEELERTRVQALRPVGEALDGIVQQLVANEAPDLLLDRSVLYYASDNVDMSATLIEQLNAQLPTVPVNRVRVSVDPAASQGGE
ncbi:OmpH family outer membrane protein [Maricaulis sp.]|uniref:OmpH family outer membrane protein n=1 Tax=Maricaulis sp. TaxID=1486257 RepID=UPI00262312E8|nr:OmpH family outer membrane protein [Maricaulis sp.]